MTVSQAFFDDIVQENEKEFDMSETEAYADARDQVNYLFSQYCVVDEK